MLKGNPQNPGKGGADNIKNATEYYQPGEDVVSLIQINTRGKMVGASIWSWFWFSPHSLCPSEHDNLPC